MNSAEYATLRTSSGLSVSWIAEHSGFSPDTAAGWEQPGGQPDSHAVRIVETVTAWQLEQIRAARGTAEDGRPLTLLLYADQFDYYTIHGAQIPFDAYNRLVMRIYMDQQASGIAARIHFFDPEAYAQWLGNAEDTRSQRGRWAATLNSDDAR
ncbi:hypothetical protein [Arthrobacter pigmenti]